MDLKVNGNGGGNGKGRVLQSWKEISAYFGVSERTAQLWEKDFQLPISREGDGPRARVFAYEEDLERWQASRRCEGNVSRPIFWRAAIGAVLLCILAVLAVRWVVSDTNVHSISLKETPPTLIALNQDSEVLWEAELASFAAEAYGGSVYFGVPRVEFHSLIVDFDNDGQNEVVFNVVPQLMSEYPGHIVCLDHDGSLLWDHPLERDLAWPPRTFHPSYFSESGLHLVTVNSQVFIVTVARHFMYFPASLIALDPSSGELMGEYWHPGHLGRLRVVDLDGDGNDEILASGINNPGPGPGHPVLVQVKGLDLIGHLGIDRQDPFGFESSIAHRYAVLPRSDTFVDYTVQGGHIEIPSPGVIRVYVGRNEGGLHYRLNTDFEVLDVRPQNTFAEAHNALYRDTRLDHTLQQAELNAMQRVLRFTGVNPDGNSPTLWKVLYGHAAKSSVYWADLALAPGAAANLKGVLPEG